MLLHFVLVHQHIKTDTRVEHVQFILPDYLPNVETTYVKYIHNVFSDPTLHFEE